MSNIVIDEKFILTDLDCQTKEAVLTAMADNLYVNGIVKASYKDAMILREQNFSTGLPTAGCGVAIPHTDIEHVNQAAISVATLKREVKFRVMGEESEEVPVKLVFMLAMKEQHAQLTLLQQLMQILQDSEALAYLAGQKDKAKIRAFMIKKLMAEGGEKK